MTAVPKYIHVRVNCAKTEATSPAKAFHANARSRTSGIANRSWGLNASKPKAAPASQSLLERKARNAAAKHASTNTEICPRTKKWKNGGKQIADMATMPGYGRRLGQNFQSQ